MISERVSDDIPSKIEILNMAIPILMRFCSLVSNLNRAARHPTKCDVINYLKLSQDILSQICDKSNKTSRNKSKCIRINILSL